MHAKFLWKLVDFVITLYIKTNQISDQMCEMLTHWQTVIHLQPGKQLSLPWGHIFQNCWSHWVLCTSTTALCLMLVLYQLQKALLLVQQHTVAGPLPLQVIDLRSHHAFGCWCGRCTLFTERDCRTPIPSTSSFPYLSGLTHEQQQELRGRLRFWVSTDNDVVSRACVCNNQVPD